MQRSQTPPNEPHEAEQEHPTPNKAAIKAICEFNDAHGVQYHKSDVFRHYNVPRATGYRILQAESSRHHESSGEKKPTGRPHKILKEQIRECEKILEENGFEGHALTWDQLAFKAGLDVHADTVKRAMGTMNYHKCIACRKGWIHPHLAERRLKHATFMLERYPEKEDWYRVRFSDEVHFDYGPQGKIWIIRKPGMRYCQDCIQEEEQPADKDKKRFHCWAAVGHDFKSDLQFYDVKSNKNGKLSLQAYIDQILEPCVKPWILRGDDFALEEDDDTGHGPSPHNIVRK